LYMKELWGPTSPSPWSVKTKPAKVNRTPMMTRSRKTGFMTFNPW